MKTWTLLLTITALLAVTTTAQAEDPDNILLRIRTENAKRLQKQDPDIAAIIKARADIAKAGVKDIDATQVQLEKGLSWAQVYFFAEQYEDSITAARRFLTSFPTPEEAFEAQQVILDSSLRLGDAKELVATLAKIKPPSPGMAAHIAQMTGSELAITVAAKLGEQAGLDLLAKAEALVPFDKLTAGSDRVMADQTRLSVAAGRAELLHGSGKHAEAVAALKAVREKLSEGSPVARLLDSKLKQAALVGNAAPALTRERGYGDFAGLESLKGKVVLLDFTAHWWPFCKRGYPAIRKLYDELKGKGLEVVSVTGYYGFFKDERGLTKDEEFTKLADHVKEFNISWPLVVGPRANAETYGVMDVPHYVVLGRDGKVISHTVGFSTDLFHRLRATVEKALAQQPAAK